MTRKEIKKWANEGLSGAYWKSILVVVCLFLTNYVVNSVTSYATSGLSSFLGLAEDTMDDTTRGVYLIYCIVVLVIGLLVGLVGFLLKVFLGNPLEVGYMRFFCVGLYRSDVKLSEMGFGFKHNYKNIAKTLCVRDIYLALFTMLSGTLYALVVLAMVLGIIAVDSYGIMWDSDAMQIVVIIAIILLGICLIILAQLPYLVKYYQYLLIPYILADNPDMPGKQVFELSKQMMKGEKWHAFVLQNLSFIGWHILGFCSFFILHILFILPYMQFSMAGFYKAVEKKYKIMNYGKNNSPII